MTDRYQGMIMVGDEEGKVSGIFYRPSQERMMKSYVSKRELPDGRRVIASEWLNEPVDWKGIQNVKFGLLKDLFGEPKRN